MKDAMLEDLRALVECESPSEDLAACKRVVELAAEISKRVTGAKGDVVEESGRPVFWLGSKSPKVVLLAHLDTVWPIGSFTPTWKVEGDIARGPGCYDMKAGFIQALYAMKDLDRNHVALIATTDEEIDGKVKVGRKGTSMYTITLHGRAAHAGLEPEKGINATIEMARIVEKLIRLENLELGTSVVPTVLKSGTTTNTVPALATLEVDSRSFSMAEMERVKSAIYGLKPENQGARIEVSGGINRPPLEESATQSLYEKLKSVASELGMGTIGSAIVGGASDGNFAGIHTQVLDGLGAVGSGAHALTENISINDLEPRAKLLTALTKAILV
jgi:glutamate carboxypeptidase